MAIDSNDEYRSKVMRTYSAKVNDSSRNALFDMRLTPMARMAGVANLEEFVGVLQLAARPPMPRAIAELMANNETSFFRDRQSFEMLRESVIPKLITSRSKERRLRIWSAASSTGQEAYSLAIMLCEYFPELAGWDVKIIGTDVLHEAVETARAGRYRRMDVNRGLPVRMLMKYSRKDGEMWQMSVPVRGMCEFIRADLCEPLPVLPVFDLVLLRNVLLYLPLLDRTRVFDRVRDRMAADGYLLLGGAEQAEDSTELFELEFTSNSYVYRPSNVD